MHDVVYQENVLCPMILGHICRWKFLEMGDFMFSQGGVIPQFVILQGGGTPQSNTQFVNLQGGGTCA